MIIKDDDNIIWDITDSLIHLGEAYGGSSIYPWNIKKQYIVAKMHVHSIHSYGKLPRDPHGHTEHVKHCTNV